MRVPELVLKEFSSEFFSTVVGHAGSGTSDSIDKHQQIYDSKLKPSFSPVLGFVKAVEASHPVYDVLFDLIGLDLESPCDRDSIIALPRL
jgi:hypothetical protein